MHQPSTERGVVIVVALFIVSLVSVLALSMMLRFERDTRRTTLILRNTKAKFYAAGSIAWAMDQLRRDWEERKEDRIIDPMPFRAEDAIVDGYHVQSTIYDMQSRFNLNNLNHPDAQKNFGRLLKAVQPKLTSSQIKAITEGIFDWIKPAGGETAFDQYYAHLQVPYRAPHRMMAHVSELKLVKGITPVIYQSLLPYVIALPEPTLINVETAKAPLLLTLNETLTLEKANEIIKWRKDHPILTPQTLLKAPPAEGGNWFIQGMTTVSGYFLLETTLSIENQVLVLYTLLHRVANQNKTAIDILWQRKGTM